MQIQKIWILEPLWKKTNKSKQKLSKVKKLVRFFLKKIQTEV